MLTFAKSSLKQFYSIPKIKSKTVYYQLSYMVKLRLFKGQRSVKKGMILE